MKTSPHLFKTRPFLRKKVWGGRRLEKLFGKQLEDDDSYGEAWEVADLKEGQCTVGSGPLEGLPLRALSKGWGRSLVGAGAPDDDRFPLLVKLLDANRDLSVQVHPGQEDARRMEGAHSKQESWLIVDADDTAEIICGLTDEVGPDEFRAAVDEGRVETLLNRIKVRVGDVIDINPGTIHAICSGVALLEIQEPSDTTYRVYDYDRPGMDGEPRELHVDQALEVATLGPCEQAVRRVGGSDEMLSVVSETPAYRIERIEVDQPCRLSWSVDPDSPQVLHLLDGSMVVEDGIGDQVELGAYDTAVVPAVLGSVRAEVPERCTVIVAGLAVEQLVRGLHRQIGQPVAS